MLQTKHNTISLAPLCGTWKLTKLLDLLLVLVEGLKSLDIHVWDIVLLGLLDVVCVSKNANGKVWPWDVRKLDGTSETLVLVDIVVLQDSLELDGLEKLALLLGGGGHDASDDFAKTFGRDLTEGHREQSAAATRECQCVPHIKTTV